MPSDLGRLCDRLLAASAPLASAGAALQGEAARLQSETERLNAAAREQPQAVAAAVGSMVAAARSCQRAAALLMQAGQEARAFVERTATGGSGGGGVTGGSDSGAVPGCGPTPSGRPDRLEGVTGAERRIPAGSVYLTDSDAHLSESASRIAPYPGEHAVVMHGAPDSVGFGELLLGPGELASVLRASTWDGTAPIRLVSCSTGQDPDGFAQRLADELGVPVTAPDKLAIVDGDGNVTVGRLENRWNPILRTHVATVVDHGCWRTLNPRRAET